MTMRVLITVIGSTRSIVNVIEILEKAEYNKHNRIQRLIGPKPCMVKRYVDDNAQVFKFFKNSFLSNWPCDLNYSTGSSNLRGDYH